MSVAETKKPKKEHHKSKSLELSPTELEKAALVAPQSTSCGAEIPSYGSVAPTMEPSPISSPVLESVQTSSDYLDYHMLNALHFNLHPQMLAATSPMYAAYYHGGPLVHPMPSHHHHHFQPQIPVVDALYMGQQNMLLENMSHSLKRMLNVSAGLA